MSWTHSKLDDTVNGQLELVRVFVTKCPESVEGAADGDSNTILLITASQYNKVSLDVSTFLTKAQLISCLPRDIVFLFSLGIDFTGGILKTPTTG